MAAVVGCVYEEGLVVNSTAKVLADTDTHLLGRLCSSAAGRISLTCKRARTQAEGLGRPK